MKRIICLLLLSVFLFCLFGCKKQETVYITPVNVYYCKNSIVYNTDNGVIAAEQKEFFGWEQKPRDFLNYYLSGTKNEDLKSPFPIGAWILKLEQNNNYADLLLNANFSRLTSGEFTLSCACLSMTVMELLGVDTVNIRIDGAGQDISIITMTKDNLIFADNTLKN